MTAVVGYVKSFMALFLLIMVLRQLVPGEKLKKYIYFFTEILLTLWFLYPVLSVLCDGDAFLETIRYEEFTERLSEASRDAERMEFLQNDYYLQQYEAAAGLDVKTTAEGYLDSYGLKVQKVDVTLTEEYNVAYMEVVFGEVDEEKIEVEGILVERGKEQGNEAIARGLAEKLRETYQLLEEQVKVQYKGS